MMINKECWLTNSEHDMIGCWFNAMEDYIIDLYGNNPIPTKLRAIEPWDVERTWTRALTGKKF